MKNILILAFLPIATVAQADSSYQWGYDSPSVIFLQPSTDCAAELVVINNLSEGAAWFAKRLDISGVSVVVNMVAGADTRPDEYRIDTDDTMVAIPNQVILQDGESANIQICSKEGAATS